MYDYIFGTNNHVPRQEETETNHKLKIAYCKAERHFGSSGNTVLESPLGILHYQQERSWAKKQKPKDRENK